MIRSLVVALTRDRIIGVAGGLPWRLSADLQRFKRLTMGHALIMGRKTYESIGRPLPGRTSIVVTREPERLRSQLPSEVLLVCSVEEAYQLASADTEAFVIGGGEIFRATLLTADRVYATWVEANLPGDTEFPPFPTSEWRMTEETSFPADAKNEYPTRYCIYDRIIAE